MRRKFDGFVWEKLDAHTSRAKVIGGWIILHQQNNKSESMIFLNDKDHEFIILDLPISSKNEEV